MEERRERGMYDNEIKTDIALLKARLESEFGSHGTKGNMYRNLDEIKDVVNKITIKFESNMFVSKDDFDRHNIQDRWLFGIIITIMLGLKLFIH